MPHDARLQAIARYPAVFLIAVPVILTITFTFVNVIACTAGAAAVSMVGILMRAQTRPVVYPVNH